MKNFKLAAIASALVATSGVAGAASDGSLGASSTGTSQVTIIKDNVVQILGVADLDLGQHAVLTADANETDGVCIFASTTNYRVTLSSGAGTTFELSDGTNSIPYTVSWTGNGVAPSGPIVSGTQIADVFTGDDASPNCGGVDNAEFGVTVAAADFNAAAAGSYTDTLTLLVQPE